MGYEYFRKALYTHEKETGASCHTSFSMNILKVGLIFLHKLKTHAEHYNEV